MLNEKKPNSYDLTPIENAGLDDLSGERLAQILKEARKSCPEQFADGEEEALLYKLRILTPLGDKLVPTLATLLVAGRAPEKCLPHFGITVNRYRGREKTGEALFLRKELRGTIPDLVIEVLTLMRNAMNVRAIVKENGLRYDVADYSLEAVREAVMNALAHRDYSPCASRPVEVSIFSDRLEIENPGGLYGPVTLDALEEGLSAARNPHLVKLLSYTPFWGETVSPNKGIGFARIRAALAREGLPEMKLEASENAFKLIFEKRAS